MENAMWLAEIKENNARVWLPVCELDGDGVLSGAVGAGINAEAQSQNSKQ